ncbi:hypothetical protein [Streptomyces incanus]|uniref:Uncharacterized protein n=1 Tax=Streptomyces incanus TaxID=887453 RepID=A0ABW0XMQ2_9ACTN
MRWSGRNKLIRNTICFDGHGITQALIVLLLYLVIAGAALGFLDRFRTPKLPVAPETEAEAAAVTVPIGAAPWPEEASVVVMTDRNPPSSVRRRPDRDGLPARLVPFPWGSQEFPYASFGFGGPSLSDVGDG